MPTLAETNMESCTDKFKLERPKQAEVINFIPQTSQPFFKNNEKGLGESAAIFYSVSDRVNRVLSSFDSSDLKSDFDYISTYFLVLTEGLRRFVKERIIMIQVIGEDDVLGIETEVNNRIEIYKDLLLRIVGALNVKIGQDTSNGLNYIENTLKRNFEGRVEHDEFLSTVNNRIEQIRQQAVAKANLSYHLTETHKAAPVPMRRVS